MPNNGITEIIENITTQLEIIESGSGHLEIVDPGTNSIEISLSGSLLSSDLDLITTSEIITIEDTPEDITISVSENPPLNVEVNSEVTNIDIIDKILLSGSSQISFTNILSNPFTTDNRGKVGRGRSQPKYELHVSGNLFSDVVSSSQAKVSELILDGDGSVNLLSVTSGSKTPFSINPEGVIILDNFQYTPTATEGALLYSGSEFYLGAVDS